jgi:hypothetical protein
VKPNGGHLEAIREVWVDEAGSSAQSDLTISAYRAGDQRGVHGSHAIPSPSRSCGGQYPGSPRLAGAKPTARAVAQFGSAARCLSVKSGPQGFDPGAAKA